MGWYLAPIIAIFCFLTGIIAIGVGGIYLISVDVLGLGIGLLAVAIVVFIVIGLSVCYTPKDERGANEQPVEAEPNAEDLPVFAELTARELPVDADPNAGDRPVDDQPNEGDRTGVRFILKEQNQDTQPELQQPA